MKYVVEIEETYRKYMIVEAESAQEAEEKMDSAYASGFIDVANDGHFENSINCNGEASELDIEVLPFLDDGDDEEEIDRG